MTRQKIAGRAKLLYTQGLTYESGLVGVSKKQTESLGGPEDIWQDDFDADFVMLNAAQARALLEQQPGWSAFQVVALQALCGLIFAIVAEFASDWGRSVAYGALATVLPNAILARGMTRKLRSVNASMAVAGLLVWEMVKVAFTLAMLFGAPWIVKNLSWPALLVGLVLTMKVHWLALAIKPRPAVPNQV